MKRTIYIFTVVSALVGTLTAGAESTTNRPSAWAQPIEAKGVPNGYKVDDALYRSAQPTAEGMRNLKTMGIRTVVNLRSFHSDQDEIGNTDLARVHIHMKAWHPEEEDVVRFLRVVTNTNRTPVLVHCTQGSDRTGTMCAIYRVAVQGWTKNQAIREMTDGGFGFHEVWVNLPPWIRDLDIEAIRKQAGIACTEQAESTVPGVVGGEGPR
jgi:protein tyrosine/serine phosphatase